MVDNADHKLPSFNCVNNGSVLIVGCHAMSLFSSKILLPFYHLHTKLFFSF
jgi:hypothetical protein